MMYLNHPLFFFIEGKTHQYYITHFLKIIIPYHQFYQLEIQINYILFY